MYSFEGSFRTQPQVSLGGRSHSSRLSKTGLLEKAHLERQKRELARKKLQSSLVLQSTVRSFLVRKKMKCDMRLEFTKLKNDKQSVTALKECIQALCFFFDQDQLTDIEHLVWLCQKLLSRSTSFETISLYSSTRILILCCRSLLRNPMLAAPLRAVEKFTASIYWDCKAWTSLSTGSAPSSSCSILPRAYLWKKLSQNRYFQCVLNVFKSRVPLDVEPSERAYPHLQVASSLVDLIMAPLSYISETYALLNNATTEVSTTEQCRISTINACDQILSNFCNEILSRDLTSQVYNYILVELRQKNDFPFLALLSFLAKSVSLENDGCIHVNMDLFAGVLRLFCHNTGTMNQHDFLVVLERLISVLPAKTYQYESDGYDSDASDTDQAQMQVFHSENLIERDVLVSDCCNFLNSPTFVDNVLKKSMISKMSIPSLCQISFHLITTLRFNVHSNRFLYELSFSNVFLKHLWTSITELKAQTRNKMGSVSSVRAILDGCEVTNSSRHNFIIRLVTFTGLFSSNLLSLHDVDFFQRGSNQSNGMAFSMKDIVSIAIIIRDLALSFVKTILPDSRSRLLEFDPRNVFHDLSNGKTSYIRSITSAAEWNGWNLQDAAIAFKYSAQLLNQLHTRHTRQSFTSDEDFWLSSSIFIGDDRSKYLSSNWRLRKLGGENKIAAHMADPSDEDIPMTISEARQLTVLTTLPYVIPFSTRTSIFKEMLFQDRQSRETHRDMAMYEFGVSEPSGIIHIKVRRDYIYEDAFNDLSLTNAPELRRSLRVTFVNQAGAEEAGYGEGVVREFFQQLVRTAFEPARGLFKLTSDSKLYPNPSAGILFNNVRHHFIFLGRLLGKIIYEGMQIELPLAAFFLCKLLRHKRFDVDINNLRSLDPDFYRNLMLLRSCDDVSDLGLNFTVVDERYGETEVTELIPDGQNVAVTNQNYVRYIHLLANYKLNVQLRPACDAFRQGVASVVPLEWLRMFNQKELQTIISGAEVAIDIEDMRINTVYSGDYASDHPTIIIFWEILETFTEEEKRKLLLFTTSCSRPPLLGFKDMQPSFCVHNGGEANRLPTSSTCLNLLRLPQYEDAETMKQKLLFCINSQSGFELS